MLNLTDILQLVIDSFNNGALSEHDLVVEIHQRVLHVLPDLRHQMHVIHKEHLKEILADVSPVGKQLSEELPREVPVLQGLPVIHVPRGEHPLYDLALVIDDQMQLEAVEPAHRALALGSPPLHGLVHVHPLHVARDQRRGVYDGDARALAQGAGLEEQQQVKGHLRLALHEAVVRNGMGKFLTHVLAHVSQIERLQVTETLRVEQHQYRHHLAVRQAAGTVAMPLAGDFQLMFFQLGSKKIAEFVENAENFY